MMLVLELNGRRPEAVINSIAVIHDPPPCAPLTAGLLLARSLHLK